MRTQRCSNRVGVANPVLNLVRRAQNLVDLKSRVNAKLEFQLNCMPLSRNDKTLTTTNPAAFLSLNEDRDNGILRRLEIRRCFGTQSPTMSTSTAVRVSQRFPRALQCPYSRLSIKLIVPAGYPVSCTRLRCLLRLFYSEANIFERQVLPRRGPLPTKVIQHSESQAGMEEETPTAASTRSRWRK
jgi:hypothetical protein